MSKLIGKQVECNRFPKRVAVVTDYNPDTGFIGLDYGRFLTTVHISECKMVVVITEREYKELTEKATV